MILIISPVKKIDPVPDPNRTEYTQLELINHSQGLDESFYFGKPIEKPRGYKIIQ